VGVLVGKPEEKRPLGRFWRRWEDKWGFKNCYIIVDHFEKNILEPDCPRMAI
jgi:hypothetical protein